MNLHSGTTKYSNDVIDKIAHEASGLPLECQDWLLMIAKGMSYTRKCITRNLAPIPVEPNHIVSEQANRT